MAILLTFTKATGGEIKKGPFASVRFEGERIVDGETGEAIAAHLPHGWTVDGEAYLRLDVSQPVSVTWTGYGGGAGTNGHLSCVNGVAYIDRRILGFVDRERNDWYLLREGRHQPFFAISPA